MTKNFPKDEQFRLKDQMTRSARSIAANIAEGFGRFHFQENIQFCRIARGSLFETKEHVFCALDENLISEPEFDDFTKNFDDLLKMLNGYISYLKKAKQGD